MYDLHREVIESLTVAPETLAGLLRGISQDRARSARDGDEGWSVVEVLCHLRDAEEISRERMRAMRDRDNPVILAYDQMALARERKYEQDDPAAALEAFARLRAGHVAELAALRPEQWDRTGQHNETGVISIYAHSLHKVHHDAIHCAQIARQLIRYER